MAVRPKRAMVLAGGLGARMRPLTLDRPKPMIQLAGKVMLDHVLDVLHAAGVETVVVNVHYLADQIEQHLKRRQTAPAIVISDERGQLLDTGGGVTKALAKLGSDPFYICNADSISLPTTPASLARLANGFDPARMDCLMLLATAAGSVGYDGLGDFTMSPDGVLARRGEREIAPFAFTGTSIADRRLFEKAPQGPFSLNLLWDKAIDNGRLHGLRQDGLWLHIGTPEALREAEQIMAHGESYF